MTSCEDVSGPTSSPSGPWYDSCNSLYDSLVTAYLQAGVIGGVVFGLILRNCKDHWSEREVMYVSYIGEIFLRMLKALILPLIVPSLITAVGSLDLSLSGE